MVWRRGERGQFPAGSWRHVRGDKQEDTRRSISFDVTGYDWPITYFLCQHCCTDAQSLPVGSISLDIRMMTAAC